MKNDSTAGRNERVWVVDRIESGIAVLVRDDDALSEDVPMAVLPPVREGTVLRVPEVRSQPAWRSSVVDDEARRERLREMEEVLKGLRKRDPGGDVVL